MSPACQDHDALVVRPHNGQTQVVLFFPDATITRTFPFTAAYLPPSMLLTFVLETHDHVTGVAHSVDLASGMALSPSVCPEVEDVMEMNIGQQWQGNCPLGACLSPLAQDLLLPSRLPSATCEGGLYHDHRYGVR